MISFGMSSIVQGTRRDMSRALRESIRVGEFHILRLFNANKAVIGVNINHLAQRVDIVSREMDEIMKLIRQGHIKPRIDKTFPLEKVADAHQYIQDRKNKGKVILTV